MHDVVFVSYAHEDVRWLRELQCHLKPLEYLCGVTVFDDREIKPGDQWKQEIASNLERAAIAVLLVSPNFLASNFIIAYELPLILDAATANRIRVIWLKTSECAVESIGIDRFQACHNVERPLDALRPTQRNRVYTDVFRLARKTLGEGSSQSTLSGDETDFVDASGDIPFLGNHSRDQIIVEARYPALASYFQRQRRLGPLATPFDDRDRWEWLVGCYRDEIASMLTGTDIFSRARFSRLLRGATEHRSYRQLVQRNVELVSDIDRAVANSHRLGMGYAAECLNRELCKEPPLTLTVSPAHTGAIAIAYYLRYVRGYPIGIRYGFAHSAAIMQSALEGELPEDANLITLSLANLATIFSKAKRMEYAPLMVLPSMSHGILAPQPELEDTPPPSAGKFLILSGVPTTELFYLEDLISRGELSRRNIRIEDAERDETAAALTDGDPDVRAIVAFPHYSLNKHFNNCRLLDRVGDSAAVREVFLFAHKSVLGDERRVTSLDVAIRDAWLTLLESQEILELVVRAILENREYVRFLVRSAGLRYVRPTKGGAGK